MCSSVVYAPRQYPGSGWPAEFTASQALMVSFTSRVGQFARLFLEVLVCMLCVFSQVIMQHWCCPLPVAGSNVVPRHGRKLAQPGVVLRRL